MVHLDTYFQLSPFTIIHLTICMILLCFFCTKKILLYVPISKIIFFKKGKTISSKLNVHTVSLLTHHQERNQLRNRPAKMRTLHSVHPGSIYWLAIFFRWPFEDESDSAVCPVHLHQHLHPPTHHVPSVQCFWYEVILPTAPIVDQTYASIIVYSINIVRILSILFSGFLSKPDAYISLLGLVNADLEWGDVLPSPCINPYLLLLCLTIFIIDCFLHCQGVVL